MNITIKSAELEQLKSLQAVSMFLQYNSWNPQKSMKLDLASVAEKDLKLITQVLSKDEKRNACPLPGRAGISQFQGVPVSLTDGPKAEGRILHRQNRIL